MSERQMTQIQSKSLRAAFTPISHSVLQRCSNGVECEECRKKRESSLQRAAVSTAPTNGVPPIVHEVLGASGQPLDASTQTFMESRFGHDFSSVRVHTDERAADSARSVNALAYTVGRDVIFGAGQYNPGTATGKRLLAHELTHVVQQSSGTVPIGNSLEIGAPDTRQEHEAETMANHLVLSSSPQIAASTNITKQRGIVQRQEHPNPLDNVAKSIIAKAKDEKVDIKVRAVTLVKDIINSYYSSEMSKVESVVFDDKKAGTGLDTESVGRGASTKGKISVGNYFIQHVDQFARRVLQVGHELQHIDQYRGGMAGGRNAEKREFLAFYREAMAPEKAGTGSISYSTRLNVIDAALGSLYCLSSEEQASFANEKSKLLKRRDEVNGKAGNAPTNPPTACKSQANIRSKRQ